ncbi:MAG: carboxypeptidase M32 [Chlorobia bacterium]|nr:carboxypeptidase M32 [Fimbriimonadaceae bacterium]
MIEVSPAYRRLLERYGNIDAIDASISLLSWDRQVLMPSGGTEARGAHVSRLARMRHSLLTNDELRQAVADVEAESSPSSVEAAVARVLRRELKTQGSLPSELIMRKSRVSSDAYEVWKQAKAENDFPALKPYLEELFSIAKETAECIGFKDHVYDPLIDLFEEGATYADARAMFDAIKGPISKLLKGIRERGNSVDDSFVAKDFDRPRLREFAQHAAKEVGFNFNAGRLDICTNAFCTHLANRDIRMTTRPSDHLKGIVSSSLHEMGHGFYEQNSPPEFEGTPLAGGISLAVHESQSRLWENIVGRSRGFWRKFLPDLQSRFPGIQTDPEGMYRAMNKVEPGFIRVGSDEVSYNLHILVRFELETEILTGQVAIADLPEAWNAKYTEYLGITPPTDTLGCLQDVHWSRGTIGYFPTYTMGNLISYQMWACLTQDLGADVLDRQDFGSVLGWLKEKVYSQGKLHVPKDLVTRVTGRPMEPTAILAGLQAKYGEIYGI